MYHLPRILPVACCLIFAGCAGSGWISGKSLLSEADSKTRPSERTDRQFERLLNETESPSRSPPGVPSEPTETREARAPRATSLDLESPAMRLLAELVSRGDLDASAATEFEQALVDSPAPIRELLVQTLLATYKRETPTRPSAGSVDPREMPEQFERPPKRDQPNAGEEALEKPLHAGHAAPRGGAVAPSAAVSASDDSAPPAEKSPLNTNAALAAAQSGSAQSAAAAGDSNSAVEAGRGSSDASSAAPAPNAKALPDPWHSQLAKAIGALEAELANQNLGNDERTRLEARLRLLYVAADRKSEAAQPVPELTENQREYWKSQLYALSVLLDAKGPPGEDRRAALALRHVREAADHLAGASTLDVRNLAFVSRVDSYGRFTEFPKAVFQPDQEVLLYVEVDNFTVEAKRDGYETALEGSYQIFDAAGHRVADHTFPVEMEVCRRPRRDFFIPYRLYMPKSVLPGEYLLQLNMRDIKGDKFGQGTIRFSIAN